MTASDKYWIKVNKFNILIDTLAVIIFITLLNGLASLAAAYYLIRITKYATQFLSMNWFNNNENDRLNQILIMPFSRKQIYKTLVKMMLFQTLVFALAYVLSAVISAFAGNYSSYLADAGGKIYPTFFTSAGYHVTNICMLLSIQINIVNIINKYTLKNKLRTYLSVFFWLLINFSINTMALSYIKKYPFVQYIYLAFMLLVLTLMIYILVKAISKNYKKFVPRR